MIGKNSVINKHLVQRPVLSLCEDNPIVVMNQTPGQADSATRYDMHYELEMGIVLAGEMVRYSGNGTQVCTPGEMWFCGIWEPHGYRSNAACHSVVIAIWPPALASLYFPELRRINWMLPFITPPDRRPVIPESLRNKLKDLVLHQVASGVQLSPARKRLFVMELLVWLFENKLLAQNIDEAASGPDQLVRITPAIDLVFEKRHLVTNKTAAKACGLSRDIFIRLFRRLMGVSFSQFAVRHRLSRAAELLLKTDLPVKTIAWEWGFTDTSHLHRLFKQHYGCTPSQFRRRERWAINKTRNPVSSPFSLTNKTVEVKMRRLATVTQPTQNKETTE